MKSFFQGNKKPPKVWVIASESKPVGTNSRSCLSWFYFHKFEKSRVTLYTAGHLHTAVPHCSHSRAPIVHTAVPRENNDHGCVYLRCRAVCKLTGCVEGHLWKCEIEYAGCLRHNKICGNVCMMISDIFGISFSVIKQLTKIRPKYLQHDFL